MTKSLNEQLGHRYVYEFYGSSLFEWKGKLCKMRGTDKDTIHVDTFILDDPMSTTWEREILPATEFTSFSDFKYPTLGYREFKTEKYNQVLFLSCKRSALRGLRVDLINPVPLPIYASLRPEHNELYWLMKDVARCRELFRPKFTSLKDGMKKLLAGDVPGFAMNEQVAVGISVNTSKDRAYDIYFRNRVVGCITDEGNVQLSNKVVNRSDFRAVFGE